MQKACTAKRERHFELSANGTAENRPSRQYALAALAVCSRCNFTGHSADIQTALTLRGTPQSKRHDDDGLLPQHIDVDDCEAAQDAAAQHRCADGVR